MTPKSPQHSATVEDGDVGNDDDASMLPLCVCVCV